MKNKLKFKVLQAIARVTRKFHPPGTDRLLRLIYHPDKRVTDCYTLVMKYDPGLMIHIDTSDFIEWSIFFYGHHEPELVRMIKKKIHPGFVMFDIGANNGCHSLLMAKQAGKEGTVIAVEPNPRSYGKLLRNIELNQLENITPLSCVLSDQPAQGYLYVPAEGVANSGVASIYCANVEGSAVEIPVEVKTLDNLVADRGLKRLDFIKIDTEGNELKVLEGGRGSVEKFRPHIVFEYDKRAWKNAGFDLDQARRYFEEVNYSLFLLQPDRLTRIEDGISTTPVNILASPVRLSGERISTSNSPLINCPHHLTTDSQCEPGIIGK